MIYKFLAEAKFNRFDIDNMIDTIRKYGLFNNHETQEEYGFSAYEKDDTIDIYFGNIHIQRVKNQKEESLKIFIKSQEDGAWAFTNNIGDYTKPVNEVYRVYINCVIDVMGEGKFFSDAYRSGNWDKYVYRSIRKLEDIVSDITDKSRFNKSYKKIVKNANI